jgi:hypothetical protein
MVTGFPITRLQLEPTKDNPDRFCEPCVMANSKRFPSPTSLNPRSKRILELHHTDIAGPYAAPSFNDMKYILTVLDDHSKLSSLVCLKSKEDVPESLMSICKDLENQCRDLPGSLHIKSIRCDNGYEYINDEVKAWGKSKGIDFQNTTPYNPQSNCSAERLNNVLWQKSTAMMVAANMD